MRVQKEKRLRRTGRGLATVMGSFVLVVAFMWMIKPYLLVLAGTEEDQRIYEDKPEALLSAYRHVEVASVSDAAEQLLGKRLYLTHRMHPLFPAKFAGFALTVRLKKQENHDPHALDGMLAAIDHGEKDAVYVMSIEDGADIAGMGGLMGTAMSART